MNVRILNWNYQIRVKLTGLLFLMIGIALILSRNDSVYQKIGFGAIFIGIYTIFVITEDSIPKILFDSQMISNMKSLYSIINSENLEGNGIYIPAGKNISNERVFIPALYNQEQGSPIINGDTVFIRGIEVEAISQDEPFNISFSSNAPPSKEVNIGGVFFPPGLELLESVEREKEKTFKNMNIEELEKNLQIMIHGLDLFRSLTIKIDNEKEIRFIIIHSIYKDVCSKIFQDMGKICRQTGCPICSSILCALTRALDKKVRIEDVRVKNDLIEYKLRIGD